MSKPTYEELVAALREAREDVSHWAAYADDYFKTKWNLTGDLQRLDDIIATAEEAEQ